MEKTKKKAIEKHPILKAWKMIRLLLLKNETASHSCRVLAGKTKSRRRPSGPPSEENRAENGWDKLGSVHQIFRVQHSRTLDVCFILLRCISIRDRTICRRKKKNETTRTGYFTVYVGPNKHRFWVKTELVNHPLFKILLEDAEREFGYSTDGPIALPCDVDHFCRVLAEIESLDGDDWSADVATMPVCWLCSSYRYSKPKSLVKDGFGSYKRLKMSSIIRQNTF